MVFFSIQLELPSHGHALNYTCMHCSSWRRIPAPPSGELPYFPHTRTAAATRNGSERTSEMEVDEAVSGAGERVDGAKQQQVQNRKRPPTPRQPPFFSREGHVRFIGNHRVGDE